MNKKIFKKEDYGIINFGKFKGKKWNEVPINYLEFLISDECYTYQNNKDIAKKELKQKNMVDGQMYLI